MKTDLSQLIGRKVNRGGTVCTIVGSVILLEYWYLDLRPKGEALKLIVVDPVGRMFQEDVGSLKLLPQE